MAAAPPNGAPQPDEHAPIQLSFPLPHAPRSLINVHLTILSTSLLLFLASTTSDAAAGSTAAMGSFVYAMPNRASPTAHPLSTPLYPQPSTLDFATRLARILARRTGRPVYVGNSISFAGAGRGGDVEEETAGLARVVEVVMGEFGRAGQARGTANTGGGMGA